MMRKKFLQTIALSAVMCSFGSIDSIKAIDCTKDYRNNKEDCNKQPTCRFTPFSPANPKSTIGKCWEDKCKPHAQEVCTGSQKENCQWKDELGGYCTVKPPSTPPSTKKKGFSGSHDD